MLISFGLVEWVITNVTRQLDLVIDHIRRHKALLERCVIGIADSQPARRVMIGEAGARPPRDSPLSGRSSTKNDVGVEREGETALVDVGLKGGGGIGDDRGAGGGREDPDARDRRSAEEGLYPRLG